MAKAEKMVKCKSCGADIPKSAKVCPNCGTKQKKKHIFLGVVLVIVGIGLFSAALGGGVSSGNIPVAEPTNKPTISLDEFNAIETGMTYEEVVEIIGSEGQVLSEVDIGEDEYKTTMYAWEGDYGLGSNANVTIQGGAVVSKAQLGLK